MNSLYLVISRKDSAINPADPTSRVDYRVQNLLTGEIFNVRWIWDLERRNPDGSWSSIHEQSILGKTLQEADDYYYQMDDDPMSVAMGYYPSSVIFNRPVGGVCDMCGKWHPEVTSPVIPDHQQMGDDGLACCPDCRN